MGNIDKDTGIWHMNIAKKRHQHDFLLVAAIATIYKPPSRAADLGCGDGWYCSMLKKYGWPEVNGYEGTPNITELGVYDDILTVDLTKLRFVDINYSFVLCLEVGEHIPKVHEQTFIDNIDRYASKDLVLSWGVPGQYSASGHVNNQPNEYIIEEFIKKGFNFNDKSTRYLRQHCSLRHFRNTVMVFARR